MKGTTDMRTEFPTRRWLQQFDAAFVANGGHNGPSTISTVRDLHAVPLYRAGATPRAAGLAAAQAYKTHAKLNLAEEAAGWR
jgi:hypothetical protein